MNPVLSRLLLTLAVDLGRYVLVAAPAFGLFWLLWGERLRARWLRPSPPERPQVRREVLSSLRTVVLFALMGLLEYLGSRAGILRMYTDAGRYGYAWLVATPFVLLLLQDTFFYFAHRAMHHRLLFSRVHREHHLSRHTSPFTAYAFSPAEALVHASFVPLVTLVLPAHELALFAFLLVMMVRNVVGHLGIELAPRWWLRSRWGALSTTVTHHALHHTRPHSNFGLYFTFWDRALGTTDPRYEERFAQVTASDVV